MMMEVANAVLIDVNSTPLGLKRQPQAQITSLAGHALTR
jgi:hypothetical protein